MPTSSSPSSRTGAARSRSNRAHGDRRVHSRGAARCAARGARLGDAAALFCWCRARAGRGVHVCTCLPSARTCGRARGLAAAVRHCLYSIGSRPSRTTGGRLAARGEPCGPHPAVANVERHSHMCAVPTSMTALDCRSRSFKLIVISQISSRHAHTDRVREDHTSADP